MLANLTVYLHLKSSSEFMEVHIFFGKKSAEEIVSVWLPFTIDSYTMGEMSRF